MLNMKKYKLNFQTHMIICMSVFVLWASVASCLEAVREIRSAQEEQKTRTLGLAIVSALTLRRIVKRLVGLTGGQTNALLTLLPLVRGEEERREVISYLDNSYLNVVGFRRPQTVAPYLDRLFLRSTSLFETFSPLVVQIARKLVRLAGGVLNAIKFLIDEITGEREKKMLLYELMNLREREVIQIKRDEEKQILYELLNAKENEIKLMKQNKENKDLLYKFLEQKDTEIKQLREDKEKKELLFKILNVKQNDLRDEELREKLYAKLMGLTFVEESEPILVPVENNC